MGGNHSTRKSSFDGSSEVDLDHFQILRAIGKGAFGKVCIVQKKDTNKMFAMKYMNKAMCIEKDAVCNVLREMEILKSLDHPFLVNEWFTFQDEEDMFMVVDLLLGGDLRYHMQDNVKFEEDRVKLYICEISQALDYLQDKHILHRDIKPDNILLDEEGHVHITDFNIATILQDGQLATSLSGTKPYIAPEVFRCAYGECLGYSYPVDWWSLGVCAYEMLRGKWPYEIDPAANVEEVLHIYDSHLVHYSSSLDEGMKDLVQQLLCLDPRCRIFSLEMLKQHSYMLDVDFEQVLSRQIKPKFVPSKDHLNCDPTFELEEMIIESKPLHKKKKRLAKQNSKQQREREGSCTSREIDPFQKCLEDIEKKFTAYNRVREDTKKLQQADSSGAHASDRTHNVDVKNQSRDVETPNET